MYDELNLVALRVSRLSVMNKYSNAFVSGHISVKYFWMLLKFGLPDISNQDETLKMSQSTA